MSVPGHDAQGDPAFVHHAMFYRDDEEYLAGVVPFIEAGIASGEPVFVAVPARRLAALRQALDGSNAQVTFADMSELGRNPGRIIPAVRRFLTAHPGGRTRFVGEPIWVDRTPEETREATRHEALLNSAFAGAQTTILCPYDVSGLDPAVVADAYRTHPTLLWRGAVAPSSSYTEPEVLLEQTYELDPAPLETPLVVFDRRHLRGARRHLAERARALGLSAGRTTDLLIAANELVTNALQHAAGPAMLRLWPGGGMIVCEVSSGGQIVDPLAGRHIPPVGAVSGRGLFMVNQICDLVQLRSSVHGTVVRLHLRRD